MKRLKISFEELTVQEKTIQTKYNELKKYSARK